MICWNKDDLKIAQKQWEEARQGDVEFDMVTIDAHRGRLVVETILVGDPPPMAAHLKIVEDVFAAIRVAK